MKYIFIQVILFDSIPNQPQTGTTNRFPVYEAVNPTYSKVIANDDTADDAVIQHYNHPQNISSAADERETEPRYTTANTTTVITNDEDID